MNSFLYLFFFNIFFMGRFFCCAVSVLCCAVTCTALRILTMTALPPLPLSTSVCLFGLSSPLLSSLHFSVFRFLCRNIFSSPLLIFRFVFVFFFFFFFCAETFHRGVQTEVDELARCVLRPLRNEQAFASPTCLPHASTMG